MKRICKSRWLVVMRLLVIVVNCEGESLGVVLGDSQSISQYLAVTHDALLRGVVTYDALATNCLVTRLR